MKHLLRQLEFPLIIIIFSENVVIYSPAGGELSQQMSHSRCMVLGNPVKLSSNHLSRSACQRIENLTQIS